MRTSIISLFSGCGGLDLGFEGSGFEVSLALDVDPIAVKTYNHNRSRKVAKQCDLATVSIGEFLDLVSRNTEKPPIGVIGGPPCQPFSNGNNTRVKDDQLRRLLPGKFAILLSALNQCSPLLFFVFENVRGITFEKHRLAFGQFKSLFEDAGFRIFEGLLDAKDFGVPQIRPRVFVVGLNKELFGDREFQFPMPLFGPPSTVADAIHGLPEPAYYAKDLARAEIPRHANHWTMRPKSVKFTNGFLREGQNRGKSFKVLAWNKPSCTVAYGNREIHIHPSGKRRLTIFEALLLQGFPSNYELLGSLSDQVRQISDAVPPPLAEAIAFQIFQTISALKQSESSRLGERLNLPIACTT